MKRLFALFPFVLMIVTLPARALEAIPPDWMDPPRTFRIDVLQVTDIEPYQQALDGFLSTLGQNGIEQGKNLLLNRVKIDFDIEKGGFWDKVGVMLRVRQEAARIAESKPDLVLTIGTPATRYARAILEDARIPVVFTAVANPLDVNAASLRDAGPGVTGSTLYMDMDESLRIVQQVFPRLRRIGMVHTDDENGVAHVAAAKAKGSDLMINVAARQVHKRDSIVPALKELYDHGQGVQMFAVPLDTYYGLRRYEPTIDLSDFGAENRIPVISFALVRVPGAILYAGADFRVVGGLAGTQAVKILKKRAKPDVLPILRQEKPTVLVDPERVQALKVALPAALLERRTQGKDGLWQVSLDD
ncbi:MAG TPA: ABC transporter substrate binding protein [Noviherbaspirillum sp.]|uniref:ABC transporter substrate-binding protein n=1 Tax=Noviherbaspirillum sp. TaxID=1926288 RepID=UPI002D40EBB1|nr:ABC transporter substrate binding protein [Noviherbaspirillum sp.]HYD95006.1 ABC transporter substrate binding protein [Noviherbaspirillum sp.]